MSLLLLVLRSLPLLMPWLGVRLACVVSLLLWSGLMVSVLVLMVSLFEISAYSLRAMESDLARTVPQGFLGLEWTMSLGNLLASRMEARNASERKSCSLVVWQVEVWMNEEHPRHDPYEDQGPVTGRCFLNKEDAVAWGIEKSLPGFDFSVEETFVY